MPNGHCSYSPDATQTFMHLVDECYRMGKRLQSNPLFREVQVRKYKRKSRAEFIRSHHEPSATSTNGLAAHNNAVTQLGRYVDDYLVPVHPYGSEKDTFFHSWPSKVTLKPSDGRVKWSANVSGHCPFCAPSGKVSTLKELVDHLCTHHPNFIYKPFRNRSCAIINMKINSSREDNVDPMYIVGSEGYMLSPKRRMNAPRYCRVPQRGDVCYPFVLRRFEVPFDYGGYIPGAPGTIDAEVNYVQPDADFATAPTANAFARVGNETEDTIMSARVKKPLGATRHPDTCKILLKLRLRPPVGLDCDSASNVGASSSLRTPGPEAKRRTFACARTKTGNAVINGPMKKPLGANGSTGILLKLRLWPLTGLDCSTIANGGASSSLRTPQRKAKRAALERKSWAVDSEVETVEAEEEVHGLHSNDSNARAKSKRKQPPDSNPLKRRIRNDPRGMRNSHTTHMRAKMFGKFARDRKAGGGEKPVINQDAADGHLFHTSTNIPLDVRRYNDGFDSDDAEDGTLRSVLKSNELQMNEFIDVPALEKYFFTLWDRFVNKEVTVRHDKVVFPTLMRFVERFGERISDMNLEANLSSMAAHFWELGLLDADGVLTVMQSFRDQNAMVVADADSPRNEIDMSNDVEHLYQGFEGISLEEKAGSSYSAAGFELFQEHDEKERTHEDVANGSRKSDAWMEAMYCSENIGQQQ